MPRAPWWVRAAAAIVCRLPAARYRATHALRRFAGAPFLMHLPPALGGYIFHCDLRDSIAREVCFTGIYEPQETQLAARLLEPGMTVVDVGANWGYFTLAAAHWVGPSGRVVAFEPERRLFTMLAGNVARNRLAHVTPRQLAVAEASGRVGLCAFDERSGNWGTSQITSVGGGQLCEVVALDDQLDREGVAEVDLLKIDVEGAEWEVIRGMQRGLARCRYRYILLECHPQLLEQRRTSVAECVAPLVAAGYRAQVIDHSAAGSRRAAYSTRRAGELLRPFDASAPGDAWPHLLLSAAGTPELA